MFTRISDFDRTLTIMNELQQRMNQIFREVEPNRVSPTTHRLNRQSWPLINLYDHSQEFILQAFVPGFSEKEIKISGQQDVLTLSGDRNQNAPEGYSVHREERGTINFSRSITFPCSVDLEKTSAELKDGLLTVRISKAPEAQPRQITIKAR